MDKPALACELEGLRREIEERLARTKSKCSFKHLLSNTDAIDTETLSECSTSLSNEINETLDQTGDVSTSTLDGSTEKDTCDPDAVNGDSLAGEKETEEILNEKEGDDGKVVEQVIENDEDENLEKGMECLIST